MTKRVAVIGAGAAGLAAARHINEQGFQCDVLEMGSQLGGTWAYTDEVGEDKYGFPVYSAMYKGLRTNLPKEVMGFPDFPICHSKSYLTQTDIQNFLIEYSQHFKLTELIKYNRMVTDVRPLKDKWQVTSIDKPTKQEITEIYDSVVICNGHYNDPIIPDIPGQETFQGKILHSHQYRSADAFENQKVLVVGAGPSGLDLTLHISKVAESVVLSHHTKEADVTEYPSNVTKKPDVREIENNIVKFIDDSQSSFDVIVFCTGYRYSFPFLHSSCGVTVDDNYIQPLYKHIIHIYRPTMCFIGVPFNVCAFQMFDLQARFFCRYLNGTLALPSESNMALDTEIEMISRWDKGYCKRQAHMMGPDQQDYYDDLAEAANTTSIQPVIVKLRNESVKRLYDDLLNFRDENYKIIDNHEFIKVQ